MNSIKKFRSRATLILASTQTGLLAADGEVSESLLQMPGIVGTLLILGILLILGLFIALLRFDSLLGLWREKIKRNQKLQFTRDLLELEEDEIDEILRTRKTALSFHLKGDELSGEGIAIDERGLIAEIAEDEVRPMVSEKKRSEIRLQTSPQLIKIIQYYLGASAFWLLFGTLIGQYAGMKFVWPDLDHFSCLSFGRLRPVHTNTVFWGWASLSMLGLAYFVVSRTSNTKIHSIRLAWLAWGGINLTLVLGNAGLFAGLNNGGGEYREYIWPFVVPFALALVLTLYNFYKTVAGRKIKEIYISNWYLIASLIWTLTLVLIGYLPYYQDGLGETVIQGYYMHQGVGMWFMTFTLGLIYYYLPSALNKPIYSYSLGVLAFWTQMLFYTLIGTHHFVFSPLPWWLQTIAIAFSVGMIIPVVAGTTNFLMTFRGSWKTVGSSYSLPFMLVGIVFYFLGSMQGSLQALRSTNDLWHLTDFNVAHSHMTMYGIITFVLWGCIYTIVPKLTGNEPKQFMVGSHFWLAFVGLIMYMISMMLGGTLKGLSWLNAEPFILSVKLMAPYWVWRAIGGSLMLFSHFVFVFNLYIMFKKTGTRNPAVSAISY